MNIHYYGKGAIVCASDNRRIYYEEKELEWLKKACYLRSSGCTDSQIIYSICNSGDGGIKHRKVGEAISAIAADGAYTESGRKDCYYPESVTLYITNRCANNCIHCFRDSSMKKDEMSYDDIEKILNVLRGNVPHIQLSGGEPLLHRNIQNVLNLLNGFKEASVVTSLFGVNQDVVNRLDVFSEIQVSLYGKDARMHDAFTGRKGSFEITCNNIQCLTKMQRPVTICFINNWKEELEEKVELARKIGAQVVRFGTIDRIGRAALNESLWSDYSIIQRDIQALTSVYLNNPVIEADEGCYSTRRKGVCGAGYVKMEIDEFGNVYPCMFGGANSVGNILMNPAMFEHKYTLTDGMVSSYKCDALLENYNYMIREKING